MNEFLFNLIVFLAFFFTFSYLIGKLLNSRRKRQIGAEVLSVVRNRYSRIRVIDLGDTCLRLLCANGGKSLPGKLELTILLTDRGNLMYYPIQLLRGRKDQIILKANLKRKPSFTLEVISLREKKLVSRASEIPVEVKFGSDLDDRFMVRATDLNQSKKLVLNRRFRSYLSDMKEDLRRVSISQVEPHVLITCDAGRRGVEKALNMASLLNSV